MSILDFVVIATFLLGVVSAAMVALHPNILYAAIALIFSLISVSGVYAALGADFLAAAQLIIYVGGVIVVILFAVMMSPELYKARILENVKKMFFPFVLALVVMVGLIKALLRTNWGELVPVSYENTTEALGRALTGPYALVFEYVAIVLFFGLIGAIVIARPHIVSREKDGSK